MATPRGSAVADMQTSRLPDADVIVIGGGISGLACGWALQQAGVDVLLLEGAAQAGGCISTARVDGYLLESGPNGALDTTPELGRIFDSLGIAGERVEADPAARKRFVVRNGVALPLPMSPLDFLRSPLFSMRAKARLCLEPFIPRAAQIDEETVATFVRRRLGKEFLDYAINPFVGGVYAGRPELLSLRSAFPRLYALEQDFGSLIRGQILGARRRARSSATSKHVAAMFSFREGMATLVNALTERLRRVERSAPVAGLCKVSQGYEVRLAPSAGSRILRARSIVLAVPAYAATCLLETLSPAAAHALQGIDYPPVTVVYSGWRRQDIAHRLDGFGVLVPECERAQILGSIFSSSLFSGRAADGRVLLTTFVGGSRQPHLAACADDRLREMVCHDLSRLLGCRAEPEFVYIRRWPRAIPQYGLGHASVMDALDAAEKASPGLYFCANYRRGIAVSDCVQAAAVTAASARAFLVVGAAG